jgi:hypothetical protein
VIEFFFVIPAKAGIQRVSAADWIALKSFTSCPGLRCARNDGKLEHVAQKILSPSEYINHKKYKNVMEYPIYYKKVYKKDINNLIVILLSARKYFNIV